ncbi:MAG: lytic transglycosylase domain-containing protein [Leptospiraceae bacterium]|nr:lytic transglycosylase domain-containing protein [Leptospiraceae bacterium]
MILITVLANCNPETGSRASKEEAKVINPCIERKAREYKEKKQGTNCLNCNADLGVSLIQNSIENEAGEIISESNLASFEKECTEELKKLAQKEIEPEPEKQPKHSRFEFSRDGKYSKIISIIEEEAAKQGVEAALIKAIVRAESNFNPNAKSHVGARGLMQLMPATAKRLKVKDILSPRDNVRGGTKFMKYLIGKFGNLDLAVAAYNAGPAVVKRYRGIPPYKETINYVKKVRKYYKEFKKEEK